MREYARIAPQFWTGPTGKDIRSLGLEAQVVAMYVLTCPHAAAIGVFHLPLLYVSNDTGLDITATQEAIDALSSIGFLAYDAPTETIWVPEMARFQIGDGLKPGDRKVKWVRDSIAAWRKSRFYGQFIDKYNESFSLGISCNEIPHRRGFAESNKPHRSLELEMELDQARESQAGHTHTERVKDSETRGYIARSPQERFEASLIPDLDAPRRTEAAKAFDRGWRQGCGRSLGISAKREQERLEAILAWADADRPGDPMGAIGDAAEAASRDSELTGMGMPFAVFAKQPGKWSVPADRDSTDTTPQAAAYRAAQAMLSASKQAFDADPSNRDVEAAYRDAKSKSVTARIAWEQVGGRP